VEHGLWSRRGIGGSIYDAMHTISSAISRNINLSSQSRPLPFTDDVRKEQKTVLQHKSPIGCTHVPQLIFWPWHFDLEVFTCIELISESWCKCTFMIIRYWAMTNSTSSYIDPPFYAVVTTIWTRFDAIRLQFFFDYDSSSNFDTRRFGCFVTWRRHGCILDVTAALMTIWLK